MRTIEEVKRFGIAYLKRPNEAVELLAHCLNKPSRALIFSEELVPDNIYDQFISLLERRKRGEPLQQIIGYVEFLNCIIEINRDVLVPRQETELLTDFVIEKIKKTSYQNKILVDLCTGSGCIAIALKKALPLLNVLAIDISEKALDIAKKNALKNKVVVEFLQGDFLEPLEGQRVDFIVSNPPYISEEEYHTLDDSVRLFEPKVALVGGASGLQFYEKMAALLPLYLNPRSSVFLEIGASQGKSVQSLFAHAPWRNGVVHKDFASHDRFFSLEIE